MVSSDSIASSERLRRISHFKDRISALRATSKVYELRSDKSINTLDSSTIASYSNASYASYGSRSVRMDVVASPVSPTVISTSTKGEKKNPFDDDTDSSYSSHESIIEEKVRGNGNAAERASNSVASDQRSYASAISLLSNGLAKGDVGRLNFSQLEERDDEARVSPKSPPARASPVTVESEVKNPFHNNDDSDEDSSDVEVKAASNNPFGVTPNPFDDSSIDDDDDDESFIGVLRAAGRPVTQQQSHAKKNNDKSVSSSDDNNTITSDSIDGDLFSGFQQLMTRKSKSEQGNRMSQFAKSYELKKPNVTDSDDDSQDASVAIDAALDGQQGKKNPFYDSDEDGNDSRDSTIDAHITNDAVRDEKQEKRNPFYGSEDDESHGSTIDADADAKQSDNQAKINSFAESDEDNSQDTTINVDGEPTVTNYAPSPNLFDASPNPLDDSSIYNDDESSCVQHLVARQTAKGQPGVNASASSSIADSSFDGTFSNASTGSSVDGALFSGFQELMTGHKTNKETTKKESGDEAKTESQETTPATDIAKQMKHRRKGSSVSHVSWSEKKSVASYSSSSFGGFSIESVEDCCEVVKPKQQIVIPELNEPEKPLPAKNVPRSSSCGLEEFSVDSTDSHAPEPVPVQAEQEASDMYELKKESSLTPAKTSVPTELSNPPESAPVPFQQESTTIIQRNRETSLKKSRRQAPSSLAEPSLAPVPIPEVVGDGGDKHEQAAEKPIKATRVENGNKQDDVRNTSAEEKGEEEVNVSGSKKKKGRKELSEQNANEKGQEATEEAAVTVEKKTQHKGKKRLEYKDGKNGTKDVKKAEYVRVQSDDYESFLAFLRSEERTSIENDPTTATSKPGKLQEGCVESGVNVAEVKRMQYTEKKKAVSSKSTPLTVAASADKKDAMKTRLHSPQVKSKFDTKKETIASLQSESLNLSNETPKKKDDMKDAMETRLHSPEVKSKQETKKKTISSLQSKSLNLSNETPKKKDDAMEIGIDAAEAESKQHTKKKKAVPSRPAPLAVSAMASKDTKYVIERSADAAKLESKHDTKKKAVSLVETSKDNEDVPSHPAPSPTSVLIGPDGDKTKPDSPIKQPQRVTLAVETAVPKKKWKMGVDSCESSSMGSTIDSALNLPVASKPSPKDDGKSTNPFADILAMRARQKKTNSIIVKRLMDRNSDISQVDLEASSQETESESASAFEQERRFVFENTDEVATSSLHNNTRMSKSVTSDSAFQSTSNKIETSESYSSSEESSEEFISLEGTIFTDLRKALSKIPSVSYEATDDENDYGSINRKAHPAISSLKDEDIQTPEDEESANANDQEDDGQTLDTTDHPKVIVRSAESCAVSSLKDTDFKVGQYTADFDVYDEEDVVSVPRSPASLENETDIETMSVPQAAKEDHDDESSEIGELEDKSRSAVHTPSVPTSYSEAVENGRDMEANLTPPKHAVVLRDGSVSTKDSIVGKTIRVTNAEIVAERIYLESLRAQVHAELKVHVADEEIRLALEARLQAIRDFYKRKATVSQLRSGPGNHDGEFLAKEAASLSQHVSNKPKILRDKSAAQSIQTALSSVSYPRGISMNVQENPAAKKSPNAQQVEPPSSADSLAPSSTASYQKGATMNSSTRNTQEIAYARAQANIDEAIKAANLSLNQPAGSFEGAKKVTESDEEEDEFLNRISAQANINADIFSQDTLWDEEEAVIPSSPSVKSQLDISNPSVLDAWTFYREINNLMSESRVYEYEFQAMQQDPLYPYLNSLVGIADSGDDGSSNADKQVKQQTRSEFKNKSPHRICHILSKEASSVLPYLIEMCEEIGRKLGMHTMAVGPVKTASAALIKSEKKYAGNPLLVTDFCRVSLFVPDISTLLALIEIVLSKYSYIVKRIKLSSLKSKHLPLIGGYRDCKINVDINGHICEIQVHLEAMWNIKEESGYSHYKSCFKNNVNDPTYDISRTLIGLDREFLSDLIKAGDGAVKSIPVSSLKPESEEHIRAYSALASLYIYYGLPVRAEYTLRQIVKLRTESVCFGPGHAETVMHLKLLRKSLKMQHKYKSASAVTKRITRAEKTANREEDIVGQCAGDQCGAIEQICDSILDPSKKEREEEKEKAQRVEDSRSIWLGVRKTYFK